MKPDNEGCIVLVVCWGLALALFAWIAVANGWGK